MRFRNKTYLRIPGGEVQYGHLSKSLVVWFRGRCFVLAGGVEKEGEWRPGFRHSMDLDFGGLGWRCVWCGGRFHVWPSDDVACSGPAKFSQETNETKETP
jgi:hypothetical protein